MENGRLMAVVGFVVGVVVGLNWHRIKKSLPKAKETMSDLLALSQEKLGAAAGAAKDKMLEVTRTAKAKAFPKPAPARRVRRVTA